MPTLHVNTAVPVYMSCLMPDYGVAKEQKKVCVLKRITFEGLVTALGSQMV